MENIECGKVYHNGRTFQAFINNTTFEKTFCEIKDNILVMPSDQDLIELNDKYNNNSGIINSPTLIANLKNKAVRKKVIVISSIIGAVSVVVSIFSPQIITALKNGYVLETESYDIPTTSQSVTVEETTETPTTILDGMGVTDPTQTTSVESTTSSVTNPSISDANAKINIITNAINNNKNLSSYDKNKLKKLIPFMLQNANYLNVKTVEQKMASLKILYGEDAKNYASWDQNELGAAATYDATDNVIKVWCAEDSAGYEALNCYAIEHEGFHLTSCTVGNPFGTGLSEGMTALLNEEFMAGTRTSTYEKTKMVTQMLCEIVGTGTMMKFYLGGANPAIIVDELAKITGTKDDAIALISQIDIFYQAASWESSNIEYSDTAIEQINNILPKLENYYNYKNRASNIKMEDDRLMTAYKNALLAPSLIKERNGVYKDYDSISFVTKGYFNKDYIKNNPTMFNIAHFFFEKDPQGDNGLRLNIQDEAIYITNDNRFEKETSYVR